LDEVHYLRIIALIFQSTKRQETPNDRKSARFPDVSSHILQCEVLTFMRGETKERWEKLCEEATVEQNPGRLVELAAEITGLLEQKEKRLTAQKSNQ